ncbi:MAG: adenylate/guanylate cyclase domain-containing protein [Nitrospinae bacterium]|nr:adenylate/guanylate cyclase domain-containing protein [Nitrospinota bacterium]
MLFSSASRGEGFIQTPGAESFRVDRHHTKTDFQKPLADRLEQVFPVKARQVFLEEFDSRRIPEMPHPHLPETEGDQADAIKCVKMALRMRERVAELQKEWQAHGIAKPLRVRMGINTGFCTVGNFGSDHRPEYTIMGSPVNLAARLEAAAEPDTILLAESTRLLIGDIAECTYVREITPKGFVRPVPIYRLDGLKGSGSHGIPMKHVGRHVEVNIVDSRHIREAIEELKQIQEEFEQRLSAAE